VDNENRSRFNVFSLVRFILPVGMVISIIILVVNSFVEVEPGQVGVVVNNTGLTLFGDDCRVIKDQGTHSVMPVFQRVEKLDIAAQKLVLEGSAEVGPDAVNMARRLDVRAKDGSSFWFDRIEVHYQVIPDSGCIVLAMYGRDNHYQKNAVPADVRAVLRDEFGRYTFEEAADPSKYTAATTAAKTELNKRLNPYGIQITQIITGKPRFRPEVEKAIEDRQTAIQEVEVQTEKRTRLTAQKDRQVQDVRQTKNAELEQLQANLAGSRKEADNKATETKREADTYFITTTSQCESERDAAKTKALANEEAFRQKAEGLKAKIDAVGAQGPDVLNVEIALHVIPQLVKLKASPFSRNPTPTTLDVRQIPVVLPEPQ
jgi:regulator of protease activity HflC (stomatin/prohibitin superfamily)